ncbi:MAG: response regulator, partial [Candidatus Polarisedimenticolia bacterium]
SPGGGRPGPAGGNSSPAEAGGPLVLVADEAREFRDLVRRTLERLGCRVEVTDDGEAAFRFAAARRPAAMILNVYLRRLLGVAVCEGVKGSPDLRATRVALVGTVFKSDRFIRAPGHLYGADDYFEDVVAPAELRRRLERLLGRTPAAVAAPARPGARAAVATAPPGEELDVAENRALAHLSEIGGEPGKAAGPDAALLDPREEIRRLARIMISDLKIYYPEEFRHALVERNFSAAFREELAQAKDLIARRFPDLPERMEWLSGALKEGLLHERSAIGGGARG